MPASASIVVILNVRAGTANGRPGIDAEIAQLFRASGHDAEIIVMAAGQNVSDAARTASARAKTPRAYASTAGGPRAKTPCFRDRRLSL